MAVRLSPQERHAAIPDTGPPARRQTVTALVRLDDVQQGIATGRLHGRIELYPADRGQTIEIEGRTVPLELEPSATLAYQLEAAPVWEMEFRGFLSATFRPQP